MITADKGGAPPEFLAALRSLRATALRPEIHLEEAPGPGRIAPWTAALTAELVPARGSDQESASGRFVVLHDPAGQEAWTGTFRLVTLTRATLEAELGADPLLSEVAWSWLQDAMAEHGLDPDVAGGTVTRVISDSFGALAERRSEVEVELRASWSPTSCDLGRDLRAWGTLLCTAAGLEPLPEVVTALGPRR